MGFIKKAVKVAKVVTNTDIKADVVNCMGCGDPIRGHKKSFCSNKCAEFYSVGKFGRGNY